MSVTYKLEVHVRCAKFGKGWYKVTAHEYFKSMTDSEIVSQVMAQDADYSAVRVSRSYEREGM